MQLHRSEHYHSLLDEESARATGGSSMRPCARVGCWSASSATG